MIKLLHLLQEENILVPRRSAEERSKNYLIATQKKIQQYMKDKEQVDLDLSYTQITSLPDGLTVRGRLDLAGTPITSLPSDLEVKTSIDLSDTKITSLPDGLKVEGHLDLDRAKITSLPDGLTVKGSLFLRGTRVGTLPGNLKVGGNLFLYHTPIAKKYSEEQIRQMVPGVEGPIYM